MTVLRGCVYKIKEVPELNLLAHQTSNQTMLIHDQQKQAGYVNLVDKAIQKQPRPPGEQSKVVRQLLIKIPWSVASKAADRSSSDKTDTRKLSEARGRSFTTLNKAVLVLWHFLWAN